MSRTKKFVINTGSTALLQIITLISGFITPQIMLRFYGSEINGLISSISQFIQYFNLVEAGLASAAIYALYKPLADNDYKGVNSIVAASKRFYIISGHIFTALSIGLALIYPLFVKTKALSTTDVGILVLLLSCSGVLEFYTLSKYRVLLTADQRLYVISLTSIFSVVISTLVVVILGNMHINIVVLRAVALLSVFVRSIILFLYVRLKYKYLDYKECADYKALDNRWNAFYLQIVSAVQVGAPVIILTFFTNLNIVSVYSVYYMIIGGINGVLGIFLSGSSATFGEIIVKKEQDILQKSIQEFEILYYGLIAVLYSVTLVTLMPFIKIYTKGITDINYNLPLIGFLFVLNGLMYNVKTPQGMLVIAAGMYRETRKQSTIQALIIIIAGLVLTPVCGLAGALVASIMSNLYRVIDLVIFIPRNVTKLPISCSVFRIIRIFITVFLICMPFAFIRFEIRNYISWFFFAIVVFIYSLIVVGVMGVCFDRKEIKRVILRLKLLLNVRRTIDKSL
ncbi:MAG: hypothetical protein Q8942_15095 [Bacillota bacterium]|nr:hypothetical protein [Bacillota bacterium]